MSFTRHEVDRDPPATVSADAEGPHQVRLASVRRPCDGQYETAIEAFEAVLGRGQRVNGDTGVRYRLSRDSFGVDDLYLYLGVEDDGSVVAAKIVSQ